MMEKISRNRLIRQISVSLLLIMAIVQLVTVIVMKLAGDLINVEEVHEFCGIVLFGLIVIHLLVFRKSLKALLFPKVKPARGSENS